VTHPSDKGDSNEIKEGRATCLELIEGIARPLAIDYIVLFS
jgi:hypothetical protein